jgi:hypothetical protein
LPLKVQTPKASCGLTFTANPAHQVTLESLMPPGNRFARASGTRPRCPPQIRPSHLRYSMPRRSPVS